MAIDTIVAAAFDTILSANPSITVSIVHMGKTATGLKRRVNYQSDISMIERGPTLGMVTFKTADLDPVTKGDTVTIDGKACMVSNVGLYAIVFTELSYVVANPIQ